jgi:hypothetical protein
MSVLYMRNATLFAHARQLAEAPTKQHSCLEWSLVARCNANFSELIFCDYILAHMTPGVM